MLSQVTRHGWVYAVRGVAAIIFGIAALVWPGPTLSVLVYMFGAFAFVDGITLLASLAQGGALARRHAWATGSEALLAFILSCVLGAATAAILSSSVLAFETFYPNLVVFQIIPKIALAPLFTFWLGIAATSRLSYSIFISFFPVALSTMTGLARTDASALLLCRALGASRWQTFFAVRVPYALPYFFSGAKVAATMSIIGIVIGEFISANEGLGYYILRAQSYGQTATIFAALVVLCALGLLLYVLPVQLERMMRRWWRE